MRAPRSCLRPLAQHLLRRRLPAQAPRRASCAARRGAPRAGRDGAPARRGSGAAARRCRAGSRTCRPGPSPRRASGRAACRAASASGAPGRAPCRRGCGRRAAARAGRSPRRSGSPASSGRTRAPARRSRTSAAAGPRAGRAAARKREATARGMATKLEVDVYVKCGKCKAKARPMNALEAQLDYCLGTATPEPGRAFEVAPGVRWVRMSAAVRAQPHQPLAAARPASPARGEPAREGWSIVDCGIDNAATRAAWEERVRDRRSTACRCCASSSPTCIPTTSARANWLCERWNARLWISATDYGIARMASSASAGFGGPLSAAFMAVHGMAADPRGGRRRRRAHQLLPQPGPRGAVVVPPPARRQHVRDRHRRGARRLELPRRLRPCARAHGAPLRVARAS